MTTFITVLTLNDVAYYTVSYFSCSLFGDPIADHSVSWFDKEFMPDALPDATFSTGLQTGTSEAPGCDT